MQRADGTRLLPPTEPAVELVKLEAPRLRRDDCWWQKYSKLDPEFRLRSTLTRVTEEGAEH